MTEDEGRAVPVRASGVLLTLWLGRARVRMSSGGLMGRWILMAAIAGASVAFSASAFAQAVAESVVTHGLSSTAGTSAGTVWCRAPKYAPRQLPCARGQHTATAEPPPVTTTIPSAVQKQT